MALNIGDTYKSDWYLSSYYKLYTQLNLNNDQQAPRVCSDQGETMSAIPCPIESCLKALSSRIALKNHLVKVHQLTIADAEARLGVMPRSSKARSQSSAEYYQRNKVKLCSSAKKKREIEKARKRIIDRRMKDPDLYIEHVSMPTRVFEPGWINRDRDLYHALDVLHSYYTTHEFFTDSTAFNIRALAARYEEDYPNKESRELQLSVDVLEKLLPFAITNLDSLRKYRKDLIEFEYLKSKHSLYAARLSKLNEVSDDELEKELERMNKLKRKN